MDKQEKLKFYDSVVADLNHWEGPSIATECLKYFDKKNPYHVDIAFTACVKLNLQPSDAMVKLMADIAIKRFSGSLTGTAKQIFKEQTKMDVFQYMLNCIYEGYDREVSAEFAVIFQSKKYKSKPYSEESLVTYYREDMKNTGLEKMYFTAWDRYKESDPQFKLNREKFKASLPHRKK